MLAPWHRHRFSRSCSSRGVGPCRLYCCQQCSISCHSSKQCCKIALPKSLASVHIHHEWYSACVTQNVCHADHPDATPKGNRRNLAATLNTFSTGPRNCIGQNLAMAEARTMLAVLLAKLQFQLPEGVQREAFLETEEVNWVTLQPRSGLLLKVSPVAT